MAKLACFIIDPEARRIYSHEWDDALDASEVLGVRSGVDFIRINAENDRLMVDERGRIDGAVHGYFTVSGYPAEIAGRALVFRIDKYGESRDPSVDMAWLEQNVHWLGLYISGVGADVTTIGNAMQIRPRAAVALTPEALQHLDWTGRVCEESVPDHRYACGRPADALIKTRDARPYFMCVACASHNIANRGGAAWARRTGISL